MQRAVRILAAVLLLVGGAVHLELWRGGYRAIPYIGPLFLANVVASLALAVALVVRAGRPVLLAAGGLAVTSLAALVMSRTVGVLGFMESGWTVQAMRTVAAEVGALVTLALIVVVRGRNLQPALVPVLARRPRRRRAG